MSSLRAAYPGSHIAWLVEAEAASALVDQPWIDEVLRFPRAALTRALQRCEPGALWRELAGFVSVLRGRRFDLVVDFHGLLRSGVLARLSGARRRVACAPPLGRELSHWFATDRARLSPARMSRFERNAGLVEYLGVAEPPAALPFAVDATARARMEAQLAPGRVPVALHPGSSRSTPYKRFGVEGYARVARELFEQLGVPSVVTAGPGSEEASLARAISDGAPGAARLAPPTPTLRELAALLAACRLCIASDSGPLHVAALVGTPVVQLLGPTDPVENAPYPATPSRSLRVALACSPCRRGCPAATCMRLISPGEVVSAARELLAAPRSLRRQAAQLRAAG